MNSFVQGVGGDRVVVQNLVPVGASPETYQPTPQDVATLSHADLIVENGSGIDAWLDRMLTNVASTNARRIVLSQGLAVVNNNPHLWMDPMYAVMYLGKIRDALVSMDPSRRVQYTQNANNYAGKLDTLERQIQKQILTQIPVQQRAMIIFHNAFDYYNRRFGIQTVGVIELSPGQDPNPQYIANLVTLARQHHVRAVFSEPEYSPKLAQSLAHSAGIHIVTDLYDDSIGTDARVHDYTSMLTYDTQTIVNALK